MRVLAYFWLKIVILRSIVAFLLRIRSLKLIKILQTKTESFGLYKPYPPATAICCPVT